MLSVDFPRSFRLKVDEAINEYLTFLSRELKCSKQLVIERCLLFAASRPSEVRLFYKEVFNESGYEE